VARQAEATGMGEPMAIEEAEVGPTSETPEGSEEQRALAEGQVAGQIRKRRWTGRRRRFDDAAVGQGHEHDGRPGPSTVATVREVRARDEAHSARAAAQPHAAPEPGLEPRGLGHAAVRERQALHANAPRPRQVRARRRARPGRAPVWTPSRATATPLT
jgi:hypothetical protein